MRAARVMLEFCLWDTSFSSYRTCSLSCGGGGRLDCLPGLLKTCQARERGGSEEAGKRDEGMLWSSVLNSYILQEPRQFN